MFLQTDVPWVTTAQKARLIRLAVPLARTMTSLTNMSAALVVRDTTVSQTLRPIRIHHVQRVGLEGRERHSTLHLIVSLVLSCVYSKQPIFGPTEEWFRELSFSRLECGVHGKLHISSADWWDLLLPLA